MCCFLTVFHIHYPIALQIPSQQRYLNNKYESHPSLQAEDCSCFMRYGPCHDCGSEEQSVLEQWEVIYMS